MSNQPQSPVLDLLRQIDAGVTIYEAFNHTPEKLRDFEDTVARLQEIERLGLIRKLFTQTRTSSASGVEEIKLVMVVGGLTEEGRQMLAQHSAASM